MDYGTAMPRSALLTLLVALWSTVEVHGQRPEKKKSPGPVVVATVGEKPIYAGQVATALARISRGKLARQDQARLEAQVLQQLVNERIALAYLVRHDEEVSRHHIDID